METRTTITLKALASELGLNTSTVSRVLNDPAGPGSKWASQETKDRIFALAKERNYRRNPYAASLRTAKSHLIGVIVPRLQDYVLATMYEGVDEAATEHGYFTVVSNSLDEAEAHRAKAEKLLDRRADGLIFGDAYFEDPYLAELAERGVPFALMNRRSPPHRSVTCDDYAGGRMVAEHFVASGRRTFALMAGNPRASTSKDRSAGFLDALAEHGITLDDDRILTGGFDAPAGTVAAEKLIAQGPLPDAVFAVNDFAAIGAHGVFTRHGVRVPDDTALVGFNDTSLAEGIGLTTVRSPMHQIGQQALSLILDILAGKDVESFQLPPELVIRSTS